ncbi:hypothetical protein [Streptomyces sp. SPB074]|uniref:hypothetical protein n=1 Tax=Streptomyces sp. (strain SPB074) TaxID=465543 RepID=UPI00017F181D|nr:hypothetical protein [Streptomyces sp. SPB074]
MIEYFDSVEEPVEGGEFLTLGAGHYAPQVAKLTVSYGDKPQEYPVRMARRAFVHAALLRPDTPPDGHFLGPSTYLHAYDAAGEKIYDQSQDPKFTKEE